MDPKKAIKLLQNVCKTASNEGNNFRFERKNGKFYATDTRRAIIVEDVEIPGAKEDGYYVWQKDLAVKIDPPEKFPDIQKLFDSDERPNEIFDFMRSGVPQIKSKDKQPLSLPSLKLGFVAGEPSVDCNNLIGLEGIEKISYSATNGPVLFEMENVSMLIMTMTT